ncbi:MAG: putative Serine/threonine protein kinase [Bryobacterales bacterium]|nr:putative Serine/threonine protein kinase [Bryobacterales bacterium]
MPAISFRDKFVLTSQVADSERHIQDLIGDSCNICKSRRTVVTPNQAPVRLTFGPFEVNASTGELLKHGSRVRLRGQPFAILVLLLQRNGEVVTREQLRERIWADGTFVDFEHGLNAAMNKLRRALSDSAENPRYVETVPGRGYRFIERVDCGPVMSCPAFQKPEVRDELPPRRRSPGLWERLTWAVGALVCLGVGLRFRGAPAGLPDWKLARITADSGLSGFPALSPQGNLIAYSSDRGLNGEQDLYLRQVAGGQPVRLTFDGTGNSAPDFSPDGGKIVFQSNRDGGGVYEVAALGGKARLLGRGGLNPKYSPDGSQVAYWVGTAAVNPAVPGSGELWVIPLNGGPPRRIAANFSAARQPIWLPDGKHLLFVGYTSPRAYENSAIDWWTASTDEDAVERSGLYEKLVHAGLQPQVTVGRLTRTLMPSPGCWSAMDKAVVFSAGTGDQNDLWEVGISPRTGKVSGLLRRLTAGTLNHTTPSCTPAGELAFTTLETRRDVWSLPFDLNRRKAKGPLERVTMGPPSREHASLAKQGRFLTFASNQAGLVNIWVRDLATGEESPVASSSVEQHYPVIAAGGDKIAFSAFEKNARDVYVSAPGGPSEKVCQGCLRATDWSLDEKTILVFAADPYQIDALDVASRRRTPILKHSKYNLVYARFSPDNRWVSFTARTQPDRALIAIAPLDGPKPVPESAWVTISEVTLGDWADWSPDGKTVYFSSRRDGHSCWWAQRIEAISGRPVGEPRAVLHLHGRVYYEPGSMSAGWSVGGERIAMLLAEGTGNIWMMSPLRSR